jgi:hypothetical protein
MQQPRTIPEQYAPAPKPIYTQPQAAYTPEYYPRPVQPTQSQHMYEAYNGRQEAGQTPPSYEPAAPQYYQGYQRGRIPIEVEDFNSDQSGYQYEYPQNYRGRKLAELAQSSPQESGLSAYTNSLLVFENRVYQISEPSSGHLGFFRRLALGLTVLALVVVVVAFATYVISERQVLAKVNETIIDMVIDENSESGIYKFFIYGNFQFIGVKVSLLTEPAEDSKLGSLHSDSYMLDQNLLQSRKLHLIKKSKGKKGVQRNGNYKNVSQNNGDSFNLDGSSILLNDSTN